MITEKQYLEYLIKQYQNLIYSICLKSVGNPFDAEDLTQEVFLSAYKTTGTGCNKHTKENIIRG